MTRKPTACHKVALKQTGGKWQGKKKKSVEAT